MSINVSILQEEDLYSDHIYCLAWHPFKGAYEIYADGC